MPRRKLTAKQRVLKRYPGAYAGQGVSTLWYIYTPALKVLTAGCTSAALAWRRAAEGCR